MKVWDVIKTANSNLLRNKSRTFLTILAITVGSFTIIMTTGVNNGVNTYIDKQMASVGGKGYLEVTKDATAGGSAGGVSISMGDDIQEYNPEKNSPMANYITPDDVKTIGKVDGIESVRPWQLLQTDYVHSDNNDKKYTISVAVKSSDSINLDMASGQIVKYDSNSPEITLSDKYVKPLGFKDANDAVGKTVKIGVSNQVTGKISEVDLKVSGVSNATIIAFGRSWITPVAGDEIYAKYSDGMPVQVKELAYMATAQIKDDHVSEAQIKAIKDDLKSKGYNSFTAEDQVGMIKTFFDAITTVLTIFGVIALLAASIGIINTLFMAVQERTREIGLMKAMGLGRFKIFAMFSWEAAMLGFWGAAIGVCLAYIAAAMANGFAATTFLKDLPGFVLVLFNPVTLVSIVLIVMVIAFLAGTLPARRASKKDPIEALRYE